MPYGNVARVRQLAGNPSTTTFPDATIQDFITFGDAQVDLYTGRTWSGTEGYLFEIAKEASNHFAAARIVETYPDAQRQTEAANKYKIAKDLCVRITELAGDLDTRSRIVHEGKYKTHPMNPSGEIHLTSKKGKVTVTPTETRLLVD